MSPDAIVQKFIDQQSARIAELKAIATELADPKLTAANMRHSLAMTDQEYVQVDRLIKSRTIEEIFSKRDKTRDKRKAK